MKFIPCNTDAWDQAEKKAKQKGKEKVNPQQARRRSSKVHRNLNAR